MKQRIFIVLAFLTIFMLSLCACMTVPQQSEPERTEPEADYKIKIQLVYPSEYVSVLEDEIYIVPGEDAVFPLVVAPGCTVLLDDSFDSTFENNRLTISGVRYPSTYVFVATPIAHRFYYEAGKGGAANASREPGTLPEGTSVTLAASVTDANYVFLGWSSGNYLTKGGTLISKELTTTVEVSGTSLYYANFKHKDEAIIRYHLNGGKVKANGADVYYSTFPTDYYYYPNTIADLGTFVRDGYTILAYSTEPNGGGYVTCPGGKVFLETDGIIDLYVQWSKWSDASLFTYENVTGGVAITSYTGNEKTVSIPAMLGGKKVVTIKAGAIVGKSMQTLVLPNTIKTIEDGAFQNCASIDTLYMFDTVTSVTDNCFKGCKKFQNFRMSAARAPVHSDIWGAYSRKWERIVALGKKENLLIILSGSSSLYATDSPLLEEKLKAAGYRFAVCNFGIQAGIPQYVYLDFMEDFLDSGDVIIQAPEINGNVHSVNFTETLHSVLESAYNIYHYLDISKYGSFFSSMATYNRNRESMKATKYSDPRRAGFETNIYGDWIKENKQGTQNISGSINPKGSSIGSDAIKRYNAAYSFYAAKGVRIYFSIPAMHGGAYKSTDAEAAAYENLIDTKLSAPRIFSVKNYVLDPKYFYNSVYHTNDVGAVVRTEQLVKDILAQFAKEGK